MERDGSPESSGPTGNAGRMEHAPSQKMETPSHRTEKGASSEKPMKDAAKSEKGEQSGNAKKSSDTAKTESSGKDRKESAGKSRGENSAAQGRSEGTEGKGSEPSGSVTQLSGEKRTQVQSAFRSHKSEAVVKDIGISINVGVNVPRSVTLYAVPEDVVVIVPAYRRYKYFIYEDKVVVVDPVTYAIIDVLILA
ncbi:DUF1236 domain-containing protein [Hyphomicrobium sp.]|uniref:DUF1236 domain-containing protein n=1 Tax=Hyphomicrobium sp. TaxID=82 RepID=UPI002E3632E8|nr:DUF1236 domain-containing protein [Hyphomicrobium sp.]HEX2842734.1 DUF1236 domain-containing protein [Hyphomicrobium sp.]